jgi:hypothetical protein
MHSGVVMFLNRVHVVMKVMLHRYISLLAP